MGRHKEHLALEVEEAPSLGSLERTDKALKGLLDLGVIEEVTESDLVAPIGLGGGDSLHVVNNKLNLSVNVVAGHLSLNYLREYIFGKNKTFKNKNNIN